MNRRCDSYNKMLIVSILIFNAIIIAFITFLFFFPFQKYELWTISLTVYMQFKKSFTGENASVSLFSRVLTTSWFTWHASYESCDLDGGCHGFLMTTKVSHLFLLTFWKMKDEVLTWQIWKMFFLSRFDSWEKLQPLRIRYYPPVKSQTS